MSDLRAMTREIQRHVGTAADGIFGPMTARAVLRELRRDRTPETVQDRTGLDARTLGNIDTLDPEARESFRSFMRLAKATAATLGCDYILISGNRTWAEQDALYAQGRTQPGSIVTNARGGQSNHNFGLAGDAGVFRAGSYLDNDNPTLAAKVHRACSEHAASCGLEWGGSWTRFRDLPHYEVATGMTMAQKRAKFSKEGSVL